MHDTDEVADTGHADRDVLSATRGSKASCWPIILATRIFWSDLYHARVLDLRPDTRNPGGLGAGAAVDRKFTDAPRVLDLGRAACYCSHA
jgi:hypothetical protein